MLRIKELGLSLSELGELEEGDILDMITERANDECKYPLRATQEDIDRFF